MKLRPAALIAFDGQSLPLGPSTAEAYPAQVMAQLRGATHNVVAVTNTSWATRSLDAARRVDRHLRRVTGPKILVDSAGTTNVNSSQTAAEILTEAETYWAARSAAGWTVVATDVPDSIGFDAGEDTKRADLNAAITTSVQLDASVAIATALGDPNGANFTDGTHLSVAGVAVVVALFVPALEAFL